MAQPRVLRNAEQWASALGGAALVAWGATRLSRSSARKSGVLMATTGAGLLWASTAGRSHAKSALASEVLVEDAVAVNRSAEELYAFWRHVPQLPAIDPQLESVRMLDDRRSRWVARTGRAKRREWIAEVIGDTPNELIAWRTTNGSDLPIAGSVEFEPLGDHRGTAVRVKLQCSVPGGRAGAAVAKLFGDAPSQVVREALRRFKQLMEAGEIPTTQGQPRGGR